ncbi:MAG: SusD/RagB family nutrient-binding outer membrane lipoprotein [Carboxylicivirga sp.]|jgi:hypothetical protein|nr:SusD/RagB family nutrient-binding outer membrane lipoprotein [Carboxylicivirga sp.]
MRNKFIYILVLILGLMACTDDFEEINTNPSDVSDPEIVYLMTKTMISMSKDEYYRYYHQMGPRILPLLEYTVGSYGGNGDKMNENFKVETYHTADVISYSRDIEHRIDNLPDEKKNILQGVKAIVTIVRIVPNLIRMEDVSEIKYTQAGIAPFTNPPVVLIPFDSEETLINTWLEELNASLELLQLDNQLSIGDQDILYKGDYEKWARLCNSLKLKIAGLLINKDRPRALKIAEEVANSPAGFIDQTSSDFYYRLNDEDFGSGDGWNVGPGAKNFIAFLREYKDPRLFLLFQKNDFNPEIIQAFIDNEVDLPPFLLDDIILDDDGNFEGYANEGEPWVRYQGMPCNSNIEWKKLPENKAYFDIGNENRLIIDGKEKSYAGVSHPQERLWQPNKTSTYPTLPGKRLEHPRADKYDKQLLMSASECYMYLAEFKLLGANLPETAEFYLKKGVGYSFDVLYYLAERNNILFYDGDPYYEDDEATNLHRDEALINAYYETELFDLSEDGLEKIYLQQYIDRFYRLEGQWNLYKRSGIPKVDSKYMAWDELSGDPANPMPLARRPYIQEPSETETNYENIMESYERMGWTLNSKDPVVMSKERHWWDSDNPEFHAGPKK